MREWHLTTGCRRCGANVRVLAVTDVDGLELYDAKLDGNEVECWCDQERLLADSSALVDLVQDELRIARAA